MCTRAAIVVTILCLCFVRDCRDALADGTSLIKRIQSDRVDDVEMAFREILRGIRVCPECYDDYSGLSEALLVVASESSSQDLRCTSWQVMDQLLRSRKLGNAQQWGDAMESEVVFLENPAGDRLGSRGSYWLLRCCGSAGEQTSPALREALRKISKQRSSTFVGVYATIALFRIEKAPPEHDTEVLRLLGDSDSSTRIYAAHGVSIIGVSCPAWDRKLAQMVVAGTPAEAASAATSLCAMGTPPQECMARLREILRAEDHQVNYFPRRISDASGPYSASVAAQLLGNLGKNGVDGIPDLEACIQGKNVILAITAIHALGELSPFSQQAAEIVKRNVTNDQQEIRNAALKVLEAHRARGMK